MDGFQLCLRNFCSYCPDFELVVVKEDCTLLGDSSPKVMNNIRCQKEERCRNIAENLKGKV